MITDCLTWFRTHAPSAAWSDRCGQIERSANNRRVWIFFFVHVCSWCYRQRVGPTPFGLQRDWVPCDIVQVPAHLVMRDSCVKVLHDLI